MIIKKAAIGFKFREQNQVHTKKRTSATRTEDFCEDKRAVIAATAAETSGEGFKKIQDAKSTHGNEEPRPAENKKTRGVDLSDETRAVNAWEVIGVLTKLHYLDKIDQVAFVFIVPRDLFHSFKQQSIVSAKVFTSTWVDSITAFDRDTRETLSNYDVTSFAQLAEAVNPYKRGEIRLLEVNDRCAWDNAVRCWEMHAKAVTRNSAIEKILQFVCAI
ncbi:hypothetical protein PC116_g18179 [Phytophthora cactorum]|uniref:Uncharacterized protein n=1 Tax=Phytophthora cactorum TaxID=29920 RepID=A0A8T1B3H8_9STRA|nr:hypothetical protein PC113_g21262 [Phytophthora cactorum]KAG2877503.1 hypothetical protein PC114_g23587 [Phytophthora cactorum]KAG2894607.1 hypothetical protein PC117_g23436 [Phytophthora cactorum]KAG2908788.1 hypothetical protein PC115_g13491 [Phytophthora cactorum]KAG2972539.1 hypothetical protein PC119_g23139 [Phytophthora cactorum]